VRSLTVCIAVLLSASPVAAQGWLTPGDSIAMLITAYETAFRNGLGTAHGSNDTTGVVCVDAPEGMLLADTVLTTLQASRRVLVRRSTACRRDATSDFGHSVSRSLMIDTLTGRRGIRISVGKITVSADGNFSFETTYWQHMLSSAGYACKGRRRGAGWEVSECKMMWIS
jgi:hypothetical protein